jgi:dihydroorotate dehydrogenase (NAD+) catalytic subunit
VALEQVGAVAAAVAVPVIGMGGIASGADALEFVAAGAAAVAVGTESFRDPGAGARIRDELAAALAKCGFDRPGDARGRALRTASQSRKGLQSEEAAPNGGAAGLDLDSSFR